LISGTSSKLPDMPGRQLHMQVRHCDTQSDRPELYTQQWPQISEMGEHQADRIECHNGGPAYEVVYRACQEV
jgi:hypothetical protein